MFGRGCESPTSTFYVKSKVSKRFYVLFLMAEKERKRPADMENKIKFQRADRQLGATPPSDKSVGCHS